MTIGTQSLLPNDLAAVEPTSRRGIVSPRDDFQAARIAQSDEIRRGQAEAAAALAPALATMGKRLTPAAIRERDKSVRRPATKPILDPKK